MTTEQSNEPPGGTGGDTVLPASSDSGLVGAVGEVADLPQSQVVTESVTNGELAKKPLSERRVPCMRFSRIVGYYQPVEQWNPGKVAEWNERMTFDISGPKYNMAGQ